MEKFKKKGIVEDYEIIRTLNLASDEFEKVMEKYMDLLLNLYPPEKIILVDIKAVSYTFDSNNNRVTVWNKEEIARMNKSSDRGFEYIKRKFPEIHIVPFPQEVMSDINHKWGNSSLHYIYEYYEYAYKCIDVIFLGLESKLENSIIELLKDECNRKCKKKFDNAVYETVKKKQDIEYWYKHSTVQKKFIKDIIVCERLNIIKENITKLKNTNISFYGFNEITEIFYKLIKENEYIVTDYIVETGKVFSKVKVIPRESISFPKVDYILVADIGNFNTIKVKLEKLKFEGKILSCEWFINDILENKL